MLKLFFGGDPATVAAHQLALHEAKLAEYVALRARAGDAMAEGQRLALEVGMAHERAMIATWRRRSREPDRPLGDGPTSARPRMMLAIAICSTEAFSSGSFSPLEAAESGNTL